MDVYKKEFLHLVSDVETGLVFASVPSASCAAALTFGLLNSTSFSVPIQLPEIRREWGRHDFNKGLYRVIWGVGVDRFPKKLLREDLKRKRKLAKIRGDYIYSLELHFEAEAQRIAEYMPEHLAVFIQNELNHCDPARNAYTKSIEEYAALQAVDVQAAYQELQLKLQSSGMVRLRNYALCDKYAMEINRCATAEELETVRESAYNAILGRGTSK